MTQIQPQPTLDFSSLSPEKFLLNFFSTKPTTTQVELTALEQQNNWPVYYHLTPQRTALLDWYEFAPEASILEIGAGCGALTGLLAQSATHLTALEPDRHRFPVLTTRYQHLPSDRFTPLSQNLSDFTHSSTPTPQFDYLTLIGVLEYASQFYSSRSTATSPFDPYLHLLENARALLAPQGKLLLAIENRLGLKYFNGCTEDHTGDYFSSLENYPHHDHIQTFTHQEIALLLHQAGFTKLNFYYPFPDYKLPQFVLAANLLKQSSLLPSTLSELWADGWSPDKKLTPFNAAAAAFFLQKEQLLPQFAPSFLIEASK